MWHANRQPRGLGGSTSVNFSCWTLGARDDYEEIARIVEDDSWNWANAQSRYKRIESYHGAPAEVPQKMEKYLSPDLKNHGSNGPIRVGFPQVWERSLMQGMDAFFEAGVEPNPDHNSGNPIGLSVCSNSAFKGIRSSAADCLVDSPSNLHILTDNEVSRVLFEGLRCVGIETLGGAIFRATNEVILSCGSLDTPRVLMHSGIGPAEQLSRFNIPVLHANDHVGQHLNDHHHNTLTFQRSEQIDDRAAFYKSKELQAAARAQWESDHTGPLSEIGCCIGMAYLKLDKVLSSPEFEALDPPTKAYLRADTVPTFEFMFNSANVQNFVDPLHTPSMATVFIFLLNRQSRGSVTLQSSDPKEPLLFDPDFLAHPYDRRVAIEMTREMLRLTSLPGYAKNTVKAMEGPASDSDEDILAWWRKSTGSTWHMTGTVRLKQQIPQLQAMRTNFCSA